MIIIYIFLLRSKAGGSERRGRYEEKAAVPPAPYAR
jgi:hypothetical protein